MEMLLHGNALLALAAAVLWGGGDFSGGMGVKRAGGGMRAALRVVLLSHCTSLVVLVAIARGRGEMRFRRGGCWRGGLRRAWRRAGAGVLLSGAVAGCDGRVGGSERTAGGGDSGGFLRCGRRVRPGRCRWRDFVVAGAAIWLIAAGDGAEASGGPGDDWLALLAGVGFGFYFVALKMAGPAGVVWPMATARMGSLSVCSIVVCGIGTAGRGCAGEAGWQGGGVGVVDGVAGYFGEPAVSGGDARGQAGCGGGAGVAVSGIDDSAGGSGAGRTADAKAGAGDGDGGGGGGDDCDLVGLILETQQQEAKANAGPSTALLTKCVSNFAQDDTLFSFSLLRGGGGIGAPALRA